MSKQLKWQPSNVGEIASADGFEYTIEGDWFGANTQKEYWKTTVYFGGELLLSSRRGSIQSAKQACHRHALSVSKAVEEAKPQHPDLDDDVRAFLNQKPDETRRRGNI